TASEAVNLLKSLITSSGDSPDVYVYKQILADTMIRAGQGKEAKDLYVELQKQKPPDLLNFIGEARAAYVAGEYAYAHDLLVRIIEKLPQGSESYWEAWLRIIQSNEK